MQLISGIILDFNSDTASVGFGITTDNGATWDTLWDLDATGNVGPTLGFTSEFTVPGNIRMGFYYTGNSDNINYFYVDDVFPVVPLTIGAYPPTFLKAKASYTEKQVTLNWNPGYSIDPILGYRVLRQEGLPEDNNPYVTLAETDNSTFSFVDTTVVLDHNYTYVVSTLSYSYHSYYSNEATAYVPEVTPVELVSFNANVYGNKVMLNWTTATETNNRGFEVERQSTGRAKANSADGEIIGQEWKSIGFVLGSGTSTEPQSYTFTDDLSSFQPADPSSQPPLSSRPQGEILLYRLKQIDFDGSYQYSNTVSVSFGVPSGFSLEQNYPNPFNPTTQISFALPVDAGVKITVFNALGQELSKIVDNTFTAGSHTVNFNASYLSSGLYFYTLEAKGVDGTSCLMSKKMMLMK